MPQHNHTLAIQHGEILPSFAGSAEAEQHYYAHRDTYLTLLSTAATHHSSFQFDYSPESLRQLERWYFNLYETDSFQIIGLDRESFEIGMAFYFGETTVRNAQAQWIVEPYFLVPNKYTFGGLMTN